MINLEIFVKEFSYDFLITGMAGSWYLLLTSTKNKTPVIATP